MIKLNIFIVFFFSLFISSTIYAIKISLITDRKRIKLVKEATEKNHVIKGKLVKNKLVRRNNVNPQDDTFTETYDLGIYEYEYNGRTYKTKVIEHLGHLQKEIDLFYVKNPKKAVSEYYLGKADISWLKHFVATFILLSLLLLINK